MSVSMYACMPVGSIYLCIYVCMCAFLYVRMDVVCRCVCVYVFLYVCTCTCVCVYAYCVCTYVCVCVDMCVCKIIQTIDRGCRNENDVASENVALAHECAICARLFEYVRL